MSCDYDLITLLLPEEEYSVGNPFNNVYLLSKFDVSSFSLTGDIEISNWSFCDFEQFKADIHFANFGQVKTVPICFFFTIVDRSQ